LLVELQPELVVAPGRFARLGEVLAALSAGDVLVPAKNLVARHGVLLPNSVLICRDPVLKRPNPATTYPWVPVLGWCGDGRPWPDATFRKLTRVSDWLARNPGRLLVPVRERSLEILEEDKTLGRLLEGPLGRADVIQELAVEFVHPPMAVTEVGGVAGRGVLVVENGTTFHSLVRAATVHAGSGLDVAWRWIGYGAGRQLGSILPSLADREPSTLAYFGDLDPEGLEIAAEGAAACREGRLPELRPHAALYEALLSTGRPQRRPSRKMWPERGLAWLGPILADRVREILPDDLWLAQEWVGLERLLADRLWLCPPPRAARHSEQRPASP